MQKSDHRENTWLQTIVAALPALLLLLAMPALSWYGDGLKDAARRQQLAGSEVLAAAQELRALTAELAAWQLAGALDLERGASYALPDGGFNRRQFLLKAQALQQHLGQTESRPALADADPADLRLLKTQLDELLRLDQQAFNAFAAADAGQGRQAADVALSGAVSLLDSLARGVDTLVTVRALRSREQARAMERTVDWSAQMQAGVLVLALMLGGLLLALLQRWLRLSQTYLSQLGRLTMTDAVSGALNRRAWTRLATAAFAQAARMGYPLTVCIVDIDRFGRFNAEHGRAAGDGLLLDLARRTKQHLRAQDLLARIDGGRFAILLVDSLPAGAGVKLQELRGVMPAPPTFSAGLAAWNGAESPDDLLARAALALQQAKQQGSSCTVTAPAVECVARDSCRHWLPAVGPSGD